MAIKSIFFIFLLFVFTVVPRIPCNGRIPERVKRKESKAVSNIGLFSRAFYLKGFLAELPYGWKRKTDELGNILFVNEDENKTTTTDPRLAFAIEETKTVDELRQKFDSSSSGFHVAHGKNLSDQVAIVTGANSGIGTAIILSFFKRITFIIFYLRIRNCQNFILSWMPCRFRL